MIKGENVFKKFLMVLFVLAFSSTIAFANTASWTQPVAYTDGSSKDTDDTFTTRVYEGTTVVCEAAASSCTFVAPNCGTGTHTYFAKTYSSKFSTESASSNTATWDAPICTKTPVAPTLLTISAQ